MMINWKGLGTKRSWPNFKVRDIDLMEDNIKSVFQNKMRGNGLD
jgi:hypothetical protein